MTFPEHATTDLTFEWIVVEDSRGRFPSHKSDLVLAYRYTFTAFAH